MPARLPIIDDLPLRWSASDAEAVLASLSASGLTAAEFSRRTGIQVQRLRRWQARGAELGALRLVEVVPRERSGGDTSVEVVSPGGWRIRVPGALLGELVRALAEGPC